jgi:hypothetical protein
VGFETAETIARRALEDPEVPEREPVPVEVDPEVYPEL